MHSLAKIFQRKKTVSPVLRSAAHALTVEAGNDALKETVGFLAGKSAQAIHVRGRVLTIACLSTQAAREITEKEKQIVTLVNEKCGNGAVEKLNLIT